MSSTGQLALYGALVAAFAIGALWRPSISVAAVLCIFGLKQWGQATSPWLAEHGPFTNYVIGALVVVSLAIRMWRGDCVLCNIRKSTWAVIALYVYALLSLLWTPRPDLALQMWAHDYPYVVTVILLAPLALRNSDDLYQSYFSLMLAGGMLVLAFLVFAKWGDRGLLISGKAYEDETNPLAIANLGGAVASAAMFLRTRWLPVLSWIVRLAFVAASLALIVKTGSRGQLIATLATLLLMLPLAFRITNLRGLIPILIAVTVIAGAAEYSVQNYIRRDDDRWGQMDAAGAATGRFAMTAQLLQHWADSPGAVLFGLGNSAAFDPEIVGSYPHDVPLETLGEEGLIGFALYGWIAWLALGGLLKGIRLSQNDADSRRLLAVASASFIFTGITTLKEGNMVGSVEFFMSAIILARMPELMTAGDRAQSLTGVAEAAAPVHFANILR